MKLNVNINDPEVRNMFTEQELEEIRLEVERLADQKLKEEVKKNLIQQQVEERLISKSSKFKIEVEGPSPESSPQNFITTSDSAAQQQIEELQKQLQEARAEVEKYKSALASKGFKLDIKGQVISTKGKDILEKLGVEREDIDEIVSNFRGDEEYDEVKEITTQFLNDKYANVETVIENKNEIIDFTSKSTSF